MQKLDFTVLVGWGHIFMMDQSDKQLIVCLVKIL